MSKKIIYLDRRLVNANHQLLDDLTPGRVSGRGVFETMRIYDGHLFAFDRHFERLLRGIKLMGMDSVITRKEALNHINKLLKMNNLKSGRIRLAVWQDKGRTRVSIVAQPLQPLPKRIYEKGISAMISRLRRKSSKVSHVKSINYGQFRTALIEAKKLKFDEAILLNQKNELVEGASTNIFIVKNHTLFTPAVSCGCLNGITRQIILEIARSMNINVRRGPVRINQLMNADEAFLTNSLIEVMPLTRLNTERIGKGKIGVMTSVLLKSYRITVKSQWFK